MKKTMFHLSIKTNLNGNEEANGSYGNEIKIKTDEKRVVCVCCLQHELYFSWNDKVTFSLCSFLCVALPQKCTHCRFAKFRWLQQILKWCEECRLWYFPGMEMHWKSDACRPAAVAIYVMKITFMTILNIIYMFDDCRSALSSHVHRLYSLIKLHAFFLKEKRRATTTALPFSLRIAFYRFIWNALLRAPNTQPANELNGHFSCYVARNNSISFPNGTWAIRVFWQMSDGNLSKQKPSTHIANTKMNIYYNYNAVIFSLFSACYFSFPAAFVDSLLNYVRFFSFKFTSFPFWCWQPS